MKSFDSFDNYAQNKITNAKASDYRGPVTENTFYRVFVSEPKTRLGLYLVSNGMLYGYKIVPKTVKPAKQWPDIAMQHSVQEAVANYRPEAKYLGEIMDYMATELLSRHVDSL